MVTNYPHLTMHDALRTTAGTERTGGFTTRLMTKLSQMFCGLRGHDMLLRLQENRMALRCASCAHETPGWELNEVPPTVTVRGDARRHQIVRPQLVGARRIA